MGMSKKDWVSAAIAAEALGVSVFHLEKLRRAGTLIARKHFKNISPGAIRPTYRYNLTKLKELI
jgi:predicted ArsR family transcriptional regulator